MNICTTGDRVGKCIAALHYLSHVSVPPQMFYFVLCNKAKSLAWVSIRPNILFELKHGATGWSALE